MDNARDSADFLFSQTRCKIAESIRAFADQRYVERFRDKPLVLTSLFSRERAEESREIREDIAFIRETDLRKP